MGGRFPRAWPQPPRRASSPAGSSAHAIPAGVAALHSNQMTEILNKYKGVNFKYSCIIHQKAFMKLTQLLKNSRKFH